MSQSREPPTAIFSTEELQRYARHIVLREVGGPGQQKLKAARVLVVGAGGLGAPVIIYLAAAGVGTLGIVDDDVVTLSNLQRQVVHRTQDVGRPKVESAARTVAELNPHISVEPHHVRLDARNAAEVVSAYDIVVDGTDNFAARFTLADVCEAAGKPLVTAAVGIFDGSVTTIVPGATRADGRPAPRFRDLFPAAPPEGLVPTCEETGILGALTGLVGSIQALEVLKLVTGVGQPLIGRLLLIDARDMRFETIDF